MKLTLVNYQSEEEINLDSDNPVVIGRGSLLACFDKKVSRNHGQLQLTPDGNVHLIALHSNPCFVMKNGLPPIIPVMKNNKKILNTGDYIGLLPDSFWYKVVVNKNECANVPDVTLNDLKSNSVTKKDCNLAETTIPITSEIDAENSKESQPSASKVDGALVSGSDKNVDEKVKSNGSLEERLKSLEHTKKLPLYMYEINYFPEESVSKNIIETPTNVVKQKEEISEQQENEKCVNKEPVIPNICEDNSQPQGQFQIHNTKDAEEDLKACEVNATSKESIKENIPHTSKELTVNEQRENGNSSENPDCPGFQRRPLCQYEGLCYRKNSQHKKDFCHPGDPDFIPYENRPVCPYGLSCYRQNKSHQIEYRHLKKKTSTIDSPKGKRRRKEPRYCDASDDDYDLEDPFTNDGTSDEFIPSDSDSDEEME